jgi:hypothetical protein
MVRHIVRVWLPDRPGALGQVASRIGSVGGDVVGIEVLERGAGQAIDELLVDLPSDDLVSLMTAEILEVDGASVEYVRQAAAAEDRGITTMRVALEVIGQAAPDQLLTALVAATARVLEGDWTVLADLTTGVHLEQIGPAPTVHWLDAYVSGTSFSGGQADGHPSEVILVDMPASGLVLATGRSAPPFRSRERMEAELLARLADRVWQASGVGPASWPSVSGSMAPAGDGSSSTSAASSATTRGSASPMNGDRVAHPDGERSPIPAGEAIDQRQA